MNEQSQLKTQPSLYEVGIRYGLLTALVWIIVDVVLRMTGLSFSVFKVYLPSSIAITVVGMVLAHRYYKSQHQYMTWREGFMIGLTLMLVSGIISTLFNYAYVNFIDPDYPARFRADMQAWFDQIPNMPEESKTEALDKMSDENMKSIAGSMKNLINVVIGAAIISTIVSAITKHSRPEFE